MQGLLNKLSPTNFCGTVNTVRELHHSRFHQDLFHIVVAAVLERCKVTSRHDDRFITIIAGFLVALYHVFGVPFGVLALNGVMGAFRWAGLDSVHIQEDKKFLNLASLIARLYNFRFVGGKPILSLLENPLQALAIITIECFCEIITSTFTIFPTYVMLSRNRECPRA